jgi:outer membrane lipoprotein SlyB
MRAILVAVILALAGCQLNQSTMGGTVVAVMEAERVEDLHSYEESPRHYDPLVPEVAWKVQVRLDDGAAVTVITNGSRRYEPGERVRLLVDADGELLL